MRVLILLHPMIIQNNLNDKKLGNRKSTFLVLGMISIPIRFGRRFVHLISRKVWPPACFAASMVAYQLAGCTGK